MSTDKQNEWSIVMIVATIATIPLDLILVPWCQRAFGNGAIGGGLSYLITEAFMVFIGIFLLPRKTILRANAWLAGKVMLAGILMVLSIYWLRDLFIGIPIIIGAIVYLTAIYFLRVLTSDDRILVNYVIQLILVRLHLMKVQTVGFDERNS